MMSSEHLKSNLKMKISTRMLICCYAFLHERKKNVEDEDPIKMAWELDESVMMGRGRPKMTWKDNVKREARKYGLREDDAQDWVKWRRMMWMNGNSNPSKMEDGNNAV